MVAAHGFTNGTAVGVMDMRSYGVVAGASGDADTSTCVMTLTPTVAQRWLSDMAFPNQRPLRPRHVAFLADEIANGRFRLSTLDIRTVDGRSYLTNGQHRLSAVVQAGVPVDFVVVQRAVPTFEEAARDYAAHDRGMLRSHQDGLMGYGLHTETGLTAKQLGRLSSAAPLILAGFRAGFNNSRTGGASAQERAEFVRAWAAPALLACATIGESSLARVRKLYNAPCYAVALATFRYAPDKAEAFWGRVAANDGLRQGTPELSLIDFITDHVSRSGAQPYIARAVAACWNAAYEGRQLKLVKVHDQTAPIRILGTPYTGKEHVAYEALS